MVLKVADVMVERLEDQWVDKMADWKVTRVVK